MWKGTGPSTFRKVQFSTTAKFRPGSVLKIQRKNHRWSLRFHATLFFFLIICSTKFWWVFCKAFKPWRELWLSIGCLTKEPLLGKASLFIQKYYMLASFSSHIAFVHLEVLSSWFLKFEIAYMSHEKCGPHWDVKYQAEISSVSREDTLFNRISPQQRAGHFENFL